MEHILRNALLLLLDQPEATLADLLKLFRDDAATGRFVTFGSWSFQNTPALPPKPLHRFKAKSRPFSAIQCCAAC
jgi:hypothetical protein